MSARSATLQPDATQNALTSPRMPLVPETPLSPMKMRGPGRRGRGRYKIPLTVPSLPRFDYSPEEVARYTRAGFVPVFSSIISPDIPAPHSAYPAPEYPSASSVQELGGHGINLEMIEVLDDFRVTDTHAVTGERDGSATHSVDSVINGVSANQDTTYYLPDLQLGPQSTAPDVVTSKSVVPPDPILSTEVNQAFRTLSQAAWQVVGLASPASSLAVDFASSLSTDVNDLQWAEITTLESSQQTTDCFMDDPEIRSASQFNDDHGSSTYTAAENGHATQDPGQSPYIEEGPEERTGPVPFLESLWNLQNKLKAKNIELTAS